jgi:hypothetical protein
MFPSLREPQENSGYTKEVQGRFLRLFIVMQSLAVELASFPENEREIIHFGEWSLKDILSHFIGWNEITSQNIRTFISNEGEIDWIPDDQIDDFNASWVEKLSGMTWDKVYEHFIKSFVDLWATYLDIPPDRLNDQLGPEEGDTPCKSLLVDISHIMDHLKEITEKCQMLQIEG